MTFEEWWEDLDKLPMNDNYTKVVAKQAWKTAWKKAYTEGWQDAKYEEAVNRSIE